MPRLFRHRWFWTLLIVLAIGGVGAVALKGRAEAQKTKQAEMAKAKAPDSPYVAIANGKADVEGGIIAVAARRGGVVRDVYVQEGDEVRRGQILARQEDDELRLAAQRAAAEVGQVQAAQEMTEVQLRTAEREFERLERLQSANFVAGQRLDAARDKIAEARATLAAQQAAVRTARARAAEADYDRELTLVRAPADGRIVRRYANPGSGASTLNVSNMFDLQPNTQRIVRAEISESAIPSVAAGQGVEITPEADESRAYAGRVVRIAPVFGARKLQSDDPSERSDERVVEVVVSADAAPLLIGQRVLVKFMKPGRAPGARVAEAAPAPSAQKR